MSVPATPPPLPDTANERLDQLSDLFRRRLLEDRTQRQLLFEQQERIDRLESDLSGERLVPLLRGLRGVVGRAMAEGADSFGASIAEEILEVLRAYGIEPINELGDLDPLRHEVVEVVGSPAAPVVGRIVTVGFAKRGRTLVPALVSVTEAE